MPQAKFKAAVLCLVASGALSAFAQQSPGPILAPAKITADNPLGLVIDHATISVKDIDKEEDFLKEMLGFKQVDSGNFGPDVKFRSLAIPGVFRIDLVQHAGSARHSPPGAFDMEQGWVHIVFKTADLDAAYKKRRRLLHRIFHH
jgi:hypothetical protein